MRSVLFILFANDIACFSFYANCRSIGWAVTMVPLGVRVVAGSNPPLSAANEVSAERGG